MMSWANGYGWLVSAALQAQVDPNPGAEHAPMPLSMLVPHLEPSHHHQKPAGGKEPQPNNIADAALCTPVDPHPQAPHGVRSIPHFPCGQRANHHLLATKTWAL